jgi:hypothetical protein
MPTTDQAIDAHDVIFSLPQSRAEWWLAGSDRGSSSTYQMSVKQDPTKNAGEGHSHPLVLQQPARIDAMSWGTYLMANEA